ncbi:MAG: transcriptional repressor LexA [Capsulimonadaceae bacterium]|nr:transcriptional repressor LexA [Capsulimonadaceae bacterium]
MARPISQRQQAILDYIGRHIEIHGYPPTVREIGEAVNLSSSSTVHAHLKSLEERGLIQRDAVLTRAIKLKETPEISFTTHHASESGIRRVPIVGTVAAGKPLLAVEDIEDYFPLPEDFINGEGFMLKVRGDSMVDDGIRDGDFVVVRRQQSADNGETVVAMMEGEATCKRFYREKDTVRLQPANAAMAPIFVQCPEILGRVVGVVRRMA